MSCGAGWSIQQLTRNAMLSSASVVFFAVYGSTHTCVAQSAVSACPIAITETSRQQDTRRSKGPWVADSPVYAVDIFQLLQRTFQ